MTRSFLLSAAMILSIAFVSIPAHATDACDGDRATTCNDTTPGDGRVHDCLLGRIDKVKPACANAIHRADALANGFINACKPDAEQWCAQYFGGAQSRIIDCLKEKKDKLRHECKSKYRQFNAYGFDVRS